MRSFSFVLFCSDVYDSILYFMNYDRDVNRKMAIFMRRVVYIITYRYGMDDAVRHTHQSSRFHKFYSTMSVNDQTVLESEG